MRALPPAGFLKYVVFSEQALAGSLDRDRRFDVSPGYLWFLTTLRGPLRLPLERIRELQLVLLALAAALAGAVAYRFAGAGAALGAGYLVIANHAARVSAAEFEPEALILALEALALGLLLRPRAEAPRAIGLALGGAALGLAAACRPTALLVGLGLGGWLAARAPRRGLLAFAAGLLLPLLLVTAVSARLGGGTRLPMDPGTVFYEGWNPLATGYAPAPPRIVKELEPRLAGPDAQHVAYRLLAERAAPQGGQARAGANRYWSRLALAFLVERPLPALELAARKALLALRGHDAYDLASMAARAEALARWPGASYALLVPLAWLGALLPRGGGSRAREAVPPLLLAALGAALPLVVFFVSARQRNPVLLPLAILAGIGLAELAGAWRQAPRRLGVLLGAVLLALTCGHEGPFEREDAYAWRASFEGARLLRAGAAARRDGHGELSAALSAEAATWLPELQPAPAPQLHLRGGDAPERLFDLGIALDHAGACAAAERAFAAAAGLGYAPHRRGVSVSSVAWQRAHTALRAGAREPARRWLGAARSEAPDEPAVLALAAELEADTRSGERLAALYDPFTAGLARAGARLDACGSGPEAEACVEALVPGLRALAAAVPGWLAPALAEARARMRCAAD